MTRHEPMSIVVVIVALFALIAIGAAIVLLNPGRERPADITPTPYVPTVVVIQDPTRPVAPPPPPHTPLPPEPLLLTPQIVPAPTRTPTPSLVPPTSTPEPTKKPMTEKVERG
jgi:hypothetical protein